MYAVILFFHILVCVLLIIVVLLQQSRGGGMSSVFGGGGSDSLFGGKGATPFFVKLTSGLAITFFVFSLILVLFSKGPRHLSAVEKGMREQPAEQLPEPAPGPGFPEGQGGE